MNMLLSFAQFEREMIGDRTRDKMSAARRRGKWTGGMPPLGYDVPPEGRRLVPVLVTTWAYSNCPFAIALPSERTEAILHGLVEAFSFFGCVPQELWWDNPLQA